MKKFVLAVLMLLLGACAPVPAKQSALLDGAAVALTGIEAFATLAPIGSYEWELAPSYTQLAMLRHRAAARLRGGRIDSSVAVMALQETDAARRLLDQAKAREGDGDKSGAASLLSAANQKLADVAVGIDRGTQ